MNSKSAMLKAGLEHSFQVIESPSVQIARVVSDHCRAHDMVVIAASSADDTSGFENDFAERVVMQAGRPVLILPRQTSGKIDFSEILLAWDGGREAARATFDAMPLLRMAQRVRLVEVDVAQRGMEPAADIADTLAHHGVKVEITHLSSDGMGTGEVLLRAMKDHGAGLLVMGAYGHGRFTELIFGGATRQVFRSAKIPVLMSH